MHISGNFSVAGINAARGMDRAQAIKSAFEETRAELQMPVDQVDFSAEALATSDANPVTETFRADRVASLREAIASGDYDTDEKLDAAMQILLDRLG